MYNMQSAQAGGSRSTESLRKTARPATQIRVLVLVVGVFVLSMLVMPPVWNAMVMMDDRVYAYFVGPSIPFQILAACFGVLALHIITLPCVYRLSKPEVQTEQMMMSIGVLFITLLGVLLTIIAFSQRSGWDYGYDDAGASYCQTANKDVFRVFATSQALQFLRAEPECLKMDSVELCEGFPDKSAEMDLLRVMENKLMCSGFCYSPNDDAAVEAFASVNARIAAGNPDAVFPELPSNVNISKLPVSLVQTPPRGLGGKLSHRVAVVTAGMEEGGEEMDGDDTGLALAQGAERRAPASLATSAGGRGRRNMAGGVTLPFPPTLFSKANYQASCDGQTFRHIKAFKTDGASVLLVEGVALLFASVFTAFLLLTSKCSSPGRRAQWALADGTGEEQRRMAPQ